MGYYISGPKKGLADALIKEHGATFIEAPISPNSTSKALIVVVNNGNFEAAAYAFDDAELRRFMDPRDGRFRTFLLMDKPLAESLSGYSNGYSNGVIND